MGKRSIFFLRNNTKGMKKKVKFLSLNLPNSSFVLSLLNRDTKNPN